MYIKVLKNNNRLLSGYYPVHIVYFKLQAKDVNAH